MVRALTLTPAGPTLRVEGVLDRGCVQRLTGLLQHLSPTAAVVIELTFARAIDSAALCDLGREVTALRQLGRTIRLVGLTIAQARLLGLALPGVSSGE